VRREWRHILRLNLPTLFIWITFDSIRWRTEFYLFWYFTSFESILKLLIKLKIWRHFERPRVFYFRTKYFLFVPISPKVPNIAEYFYEKNFRRYWASPSCFCYKSIVFKCLVIFRYQIKLMLFLVSRIFFPKGSKWSTVTFMTKNPRGFKLEKSSNLYISL
jgi:hypothetical protein